MLAQTPPRQGFCRLGPRQDTRRNVFIFISVILDQWVIPLPLSAPATLTPECCVSWCCVHGVVCLPARVALDRSLSIWHSWVPLNLMWSLKAQWEAWAGAVLSALPSALIVGDRVLCSMGDTSIWQGWLGMLPDFLKCCLETKLNIAELHQVCSAELAAQGKGRFIFIIIFYFFLSHMRNNSLFSCWRR